MVDQFTALDHQLTEKCQKAKIPGMALVVAKEGQPVFEKYYGYRDVDKQLPVDGDTVFGVASITKSFVTLAIMQLADAGKLSVNDPITKWLPEFKLVDEACTEAAQIHHLMSHTVGLPGLPIVGQARATSIKEDPDGEYLFGEVPNLTDQKHLGVVDLLNLLADYEYELLGKPGEAFNYSNESYAFLQEIIERASGQSFTEYMDEHILQPLEMERSTFLKEDMDKMDNVTELYAYTVDDEKKVFHTPAWWDVGLVYSTGALKASALDLIRYLEVYRGQGKVKGQEIASKESIEQMTSIQAKSPNGVNYGYGLQIHQRYGQEIVGHGGSIKGVSSHILYCEKEDITVSVLTNISNVDAGDLAMTAMRHALGQEEEAKPELIEQPVELLQNYVGTYSSMEGNSMAVDILDDQLQLVMEVDRIPLKPIGEDLFMSASGRKFAFVVEAGKVKGLYSGVRFIPKSK